jgi:hypothetical protein
VIKIDGLLHDFRAEIVFNAASGAGGIDGQ